MIPLSPVDASLREVAPCIVRMTSMSAVHLRGIDLNLLVPLHALLEERSVTRAAQRIHLTQSAMSRALECLREVLQDDLLVRSQGRYELTARSADLLRELNVLLPLLQQFWSGGAFAPADVEARIRLSMTDYAAAVMLPYLMKALELRAPGVTLEVIPWHERAHEDLSAAKIDLLFSPLAVPAGLSLEPLFEERFVCLSKRGSNSSQRAMPLSSFLRCRHISVETEPNQSNLIDRALAEKGLRRNVVLRVPFLLPALRVLQQTDLLMTTPHRLALIASKDSGLHVAHCPRELPTFQYTSVWHPRLDRDPLHVWFRSLVVQTCREHLEE